MHGIFSWEQARVEQKNPSCVKVHLQDFASGIGTKYDIVFQESDRILE